MKAKWNGLFTRHAAACGFCALIFLSLHAQNKCTKQYGDLALKQTQVPNLYIPGADIIKGYIEHLPPDYYSSPSKKYPLFIYVHGAYQAGTGAANDPNGLCLLYGDSQWSGFPTNMVEGWPEPFPDYVSNPLTGQTSSFILISPQFAYFSDPANTMNAFLDYLLTRYRVDAARIYLSGISAGANFILDYVQSSVAAAGRIAAIAPVSPCENLFAQGAANIAHANLPVWAFQCTTDGNCGQTPTHAQDIISDINSQLPVPNPRANATIFPLPAIPCDPDVSHDTWRFAYNQFQTLTQSAWGSPVNLYQWMLQFNRSAQITPTPVNFKSFSANLNNNKVYLRWVVAQETDTKEFTVEKAGPDQQFRVLSVIPSKGNSPTDQVYEAMDDKPLPHLAYYRISQTGIDGSKQYFEIRKVINNASSGQDLIISPNPFTSKLSAYVTLDRAQHVSAVITDMNGKKLRSMRGQYAQGGTEIIINADGLPAGVYFLKMEGENFSLIRKVVKQ